ncbi:helix-turn-helix transcriptional regulator [Sphingosinicella soli]|uniref:LuxR family quorum-sensing system transcriptional regulator CciR n=1 Tax=Sphingosinicella soli TaxID=333708 RepID=A0A7W7B4H5_9SPHN|nr:autoinducer binding domain-containing protein [Sphingosinicella soli]MBB4633853.1 LuxR family quorum-sensing system transcriptional regulator CciR [Sphingosinicella soli]
MLFKKVQGFVDKAKKADDLLTLTNLTQAITEELGFDCFALLHSPRQSSAPAESLQLTTYPDLWIEMVRDRAYWVDDPVFAACEIAVAGFPWAQIPDLVVLSERQRDVMRLAREEGLLDGFTVPIPKGGTTVGLCSFATRRERGDDHYGAAAAQSVGWFASEAARRIAAHEPAPSPPAAALTPRQLDCIVLYARGKSDAAMAQLLGISPRTCNEHMEIAKRRYGVATRQQLLARVLWNGQLSFADILG